MSSSNLNDAGLRGGVALVTGGSRGIGRAVVELLASEGMSVIFAYRENAAAAAEVVKADKDQRTSAERLDVRDAAACLGFVEKVVERTGRIDLLVNNAGVIRDNPVTALDEEEVRLVLETNVTGAFNMTRAVAPHMISRRVGKIVNISSVAGEKGGRGQTNYAASKGALNAFTRSLAVELAPRGITVNAVAPGVIETEMSREVRERAGDQVLSRILLRRIGRTVDVAYAVWFLASRYADYITGEILHVDGGFKME
jgi:3-oxoacyl-[acyl-carrier protein] reductase